MSGGITFPGASFPATRMRRNRSSAWLRRLVAENHVAIGDLIWPVFVEEGEARETPIPSMPGVLRYSPDRLIEAAREAAQLGIAAIALFPYVEGDRKDPAGSEAINPDNLICRSLRRLKDALPDLGVVCDVALDPYNSDGHDGLLQDGKILNDESLEILCRQAVVQADAGCDVIAPSDMMDGRVAAIRKALDAGGHQDVAIMSYAAKYASAFYGPFRDAIGSGGYLKGDKKTYQMDCANADEALREVALDIAEGADMVMIKPGLAYIDIVHRIKTRFGLPTFAYQVSGEYAMMKAAVEQGWLDNDRVVLETLMAFKRAGCDGILTYTAVEAARLLRDLE